ncbi:MAG: hypothetical protein QXL82_01700 [Candidatus Aenigmatarchaeota archaeon]
MKIYKVGRYYEYKVKKHLENLGYIVFRSAGSHGYFDLIAIHPITKNILFIQVKKTFKKDKNLNEMIEKFKNFGNDAKVYFQIWIKDGRKFKIIDVK